MTKDWIKWYNKGWNLTEKGTELLKNGYFYFYGRDENYKPIVIMDYSKYDSKKVKYVLKLLISLVLH